MTLPKILLIGNSHTGAIRQAAEDHADELGMDIEVCWLKGSKGISAHGDTTRAEAREKVAALSPDSLLLLTFIGTQHNVLGLLQHPQPFHFIDTPVQDAALIPMPVIRAHLQDFFAKETVIEELTQLAPCPSYHIMAPPPKADLSRFNNNKRSRKHPSGLSIAEIGFTDPMVRLAFWQIEEQVLGDYIRSLGAEVFPLPHTTLDNQGFLALPYQGNDNTHANTAYGKLILEAALDLVNRRSAAMSSPTA